MHASRIPCITLRWDDGFSISYGYTCGEGVVSTSPKSQNIPAMIPNPSRAIEPSMCSFGACCEHAEYECGIHIVGKPNVSAKTSLGSEPPRLGNMAGLMPVVRSMLATAQ